MYLSMHLSSLALSLLDRPKLAPLLFYPFVTVLCLFVTLLFGQTILPVKGEPLGEKGLTAGSYRAVLAVLA